MKIPVSRALAKQLFLLVFLCFGSLGQVLAQSWIAPKIGQTPEAITGFDLVDHSPVDLSKYKDNVLVVYFGADWCPPCVLTTRPHILNLIQKYKGKNVKFLYMNNDPNDLREKRKLEAKQLDIDIAMPTLKNCPLGECKGGLRTTTGLIGEYGKVYWFPSVHLLDKSGKMVYKNEKSNSIVNDLEGEIEKHLAQAH
jgi:thiol-disulfide isomerase/thioredoxin